MNYRLLHKKANSCSPCNCCSIFNWKYFLGVNFVQKLKIISLNWNFVPSLIKICRIPWWCSLFLFATENTFLQKFSPKNQNLSVWAEISHLTNLNMQKYEENMWCSLFLCYTRKIFFRKIWSKKSKHLVQRE